jgi:hypothetical protein
LLTDPEVIVQWPRFRSERDFWRFAPDGVICAFGTSEAASDERSIGDFLVIEDSHHAYLAYPRALRAFSGDAGRISMERW